MRLDNSARMNTPGRAENNWYAEIVDKSLQKTHLICTRCLQDVAHRRQWSLGTAWPGGS